MFVVRPLVHWLTTNTGGNTEILNRLPKTIQEIEQEYQPAAKSLPNRARALEMITKDSDKSAQVMQEWLKGTT